MRTRAFTRALAVSAITALGAAGTVGIAHASARAAVTIAKPYDFNGDGHPDLALGDPYGTVSGHTTAGFVTIVYGSASGLDTSKKQIFSQATTDVPGTPEAADHFGFSLTSFDYNRDGYADLLVGAPDEDTTDGVNAGSETILWGTPSGLTATDSDAIAEPDTPGANHRFGFSLAAADFDGDGYSEWIDTAPGDGEPYLFTSNPGTTAATVQSTRSFHPTARVLRSVRHGVSAAADSPVTSFIPVVGDVNGDGHPEIVLGWQAATDPSSGFDVYSVTTSAVTLVNSVTTRVDSLAVGDFDGDGFADIAAGGADESAGVGGHVTVYKGDAGVTLGTSTTITQDSVGMPGPAGVSGDHFGFSLSAGDVNGDGKQDLAVGVPFQAVGTATEAGAAIVMFGSASGLSGAGSQSVTQNTAGVPGVAESGDRLGWTVSLFDPNVDGRADLVAGAPKENGTDGAVSYLMGTTSGVTGTGSLTFGAGTLGITGLDAQVGVRIGRTA